MDNLYMSKYLVSDAGVGCYFPPLHVIVLEGKI
jgi:hypothetical protein